MSIRTRKYIEDIITAVTSTVSRQSASGILLPHMLLEGDYDYNKEKNYDHQCYVS